MGLWFVLFEEDLELVRLIEFLESSVPALPSMAFNSL